MESIKHRCVCRYGRSISTLLYLLGLTQFIIISPEISLGAQFDSERFRKFIDVVQATAEPTEKEKRAYEFVQSLTEDSYPLIENDTTAVLIYLGEDDSVSFLSDLTDWVEPMTMKRIKGTSVSYIRLHAPPDARLEYMFVVGAEKIPVPDSLNARRIYYAIWYTSELAMPGYEPHPFFEKFRSGQPGSFEKVHALELEDSIMGYPHTIHIYLPPGYESEMKRYPVLYFQDGSDYIESAYTPELIHALIESRNIEPVIAVFVTPPNRHQPQMPNRMTEYGMNDDYVRFFTEELVPFIDRTYRTKTDPSDRLVIGDSYAGLISAYIAYMRPEVFGNVYSQSGYFSFDRDRIIELFKDSSIKPVRLFIDIGIYERNVAAQILPATETDFLSANRRMRDGLSDKGYDFIYREFPEGHTWGNWRRRLIDALGYFYGCKEDSH
jgi:enterochelin esterase-like enzyme